MKLWYETWIGWLPALVDSIPKEIDAYIERGGFVMVEWETDEGGP